MKKLIIIAILFISYSKNTMAQGITDNRERFQFGIRGGLNYANVYDAQGEEFNSDAKFGFLGGALLAIPFGKYLGFQPEVLYSQKGFTAQGKILGNPYSFTRTSTYIDIPLQFMLKPSEFITLLVGPQYSYLTSQKDVFSNTANSFVQEQEFARDNIRKNILGIVLGLDINLKHLLLGVKGSWDVQTNNGDGSSYTPRYKNSVIQFTVGYKFYN